MLWWVMGRGPQLLRPPQSRCRARRCSKLRSESELHIGAASVSSMLRYSLKASEQAERGWW